MWKIPANKFNVFKKKNDEEFKNFKKDEKAFQSLSLIKLKAVLSMSNEMKNFHSVSKKF